MPNPNWNSINTRFFRWTRSLEKIICSYYLPNLTGPLIYITSDYSGSHQSSKYQVLSVLYVDIKSSFEWEIDRRKVRRTYLADGRRMSFKGLNDNKKQRALIPFLDAANKIRGLSVTLVINKTIQNLCLNKGDLGSVLKAFELESK